jgi:NOL1/NOP2/sun family putative RNA methylase
MNIKDPAADTLVTRYGALSGDASSFEAALTTPLPVTLWTNRLRVSDDRLAALLKTDGFTVEKVNWLDGAFRLATDSRPGLSWLYKAGLFQIQEEAAMLPVTLLDPKPGERVLDLCAAPGNKTAQISLALGNRGTVIANDVHSGRHAGLHVTIARLGLQNITTTAFDGASYPYEAGSFDKVLADVPCSGEGTIRKGYGAHKPVPEDFRRKLCGLQRALLRRAIDLCRPGGRIVYSTCTFAPEENEAIVDQVIRERPGEIRLIEATVPNLQTSPGLSEWQGRKFNADCALTHRLWPHVTDTGGFFAAVIEKTGGMGLPRSEIPSFPAIAPGLETALATFQERFGIPGDLFRNNWSLRAGRRIRLAAIDHVAALRPAPIVTGLTLTRAGTSHFKLSTEAAMAFGANATRNIVDLEPQERDRYLVRETLEIAAERIENGSGPGYVLVRSQGFTLGLASLHQDEQGIRLESLFPGGWC